MAQIKSYRQLCGNCGWAGEYTDNPDTWSHSGCPKCSGPLSLQTERFNVPVDLANAEDLDQGSPYLWDQEIADNADDEEADRDGDR